MIMSMPCKIWKTYNLKTLDEYSDLYSKTDVLRLVDIIENFRKSCHATYKLDPLHYYTAPGRTFDAMLKLTKIKLKLLTDPEMVLHIENSIKGGVSQCFNCYTKANNPYMTLDYNPAEPESYIFYFDINYQFVKSMSEYFPYSDSKWVRKFSIIDYINIPDDSPRGYILKVDLEYPKKLHDLFKDLPPFPEHFVPPCSTCKIPKLKANLCSKKTYVLHYRNLKLY